MKPIANLNEVAFTDIEGNGYCTSRRAQFSDSIGARKLGYNLTVLPPGKAQCPFHHHHGEEEMFRAESHVTCYDGESTEPPTTPGGTA